MGNFLVALVVVGALIALLVMFVRGIKVQHEGKVGVVEAWGRFARVVPPGRYTLWPWESIVDEIPLQMFEYETPPQNIATRGINMTVTMVIHFQIEHAHRVGRNLLPPQVIDPEPPTPTYAPAPDLRPDRLEPASRPRPNNRTTNATGYRTPVRPSGASGMLSRVLGRPSQLDIHHAAYRARYTVPDWRAATEHEAIATLQQMFSTISVSEDIIGNINWQHDLGERVRARLTAKTERWGVEILDVTFKDLKLPENAVTNLSAETKAEREARAREREAKNYSDIAEILKLTPAELLRWRQIEVLRELAKNPQARIMFSTDMAGRSFPAFTDEQRPQPQPTPQGYLGSEPPTPALPPARPDSGPVQYPTAPSLQRTDQQ